MNQYKFINSVGKYMIDLIELNNSPYIEINYTNGYIFLAYNPSNHLIFVRFTKIHAQFMFKISAKRNFTFLKNLLFKEFTSV
jgi:hypothetical protein